MPAADAPVLRNKLWHAVRNLAHGTCHLIVFGNAATLEVVARQAYVVDDFGALAPVDDGCSSPNDEFWWSTFAVDAAACDWWTAQLADAGHAERQRRARQRTHDLLRPPPVTVEIVTEPQHPLCVASIVVGPDPRLDAPLYSVHVDREERLLLTHAQLCALLLAASELVRSTTPTGSLQ